MSTLKPLNIFFVPAKSADDSPAMLDYLRTIANVKTAAADRHENANNIAGLKKSESRSDIRAIACVLTAPTVNKRNSIGGISIGRGIYDLGTAALEAQIPTYLLMGKCDDLWQFYPVIGITREPSNTDWKINYGTALLESSACASYLWPWTR